jgi:hypothetical protein
MLNREIYQNDPSKKKILNEGVVNVSEEKSEEAMALLRYELDTFVCKGEYENGLRHILDNYLKNIDRPQQPGVWISGFFGSGKSHLVKMLRSLWVDTQFSDGATARGIANIPTSITELLRELNTRGKRLGGLHAASGTLGAGASGSVRLALLRIVFKSIDLPEQYPIANFVMWLKSEGILNKVKKKVEDSGYDWEIELSNFHVAEGLYKAICDVKPAVFSPALSASEVLTKIYPNVDDISNNEMINAIRKALSIKGKFPLTLIALDEVQQFIGEDSLRSMAVQELVETCSKNFAGKLLFIGTGQTAVTGTPSLQRLEGRFTVRIELSDNDVETVIREVILAKKTQAIPDIEKVMNENIGEIARHLSGTSIAHRREDVDDFVQDYPILPTRRRFWENTLKVLDQTGTQSQLRNQLNMVHKAIQSNLDNSLGSVIGADYLYFDSAEKLLQTRILPRNVYEKTVAWKNGSDDEVLLARAAGLIFLINKLSSNNSQIGITATIDTIADLLVEDLSEGSGPLRKQLENILSKCELLMPVGNEYRIQTEESVTWTNEFLTEKNALANQPHRIESERIDRIKSLVSKTIGKISIIQGNSKVKRTIFHVFNSKLPDDHDKQVYIWIRDGWSVDEKSVVADARQARNQSPTVYMFIPRRSADELRRSVMDFKASSLTLDKRGIPNTPEGIEAREAMETIKRNSETRIDTLINELISGASVYQGGGNEVIDTSLDAKIKTAAEASFQRLYPQFDVADHANWGDVYRKAKLGSLEALKSVNYDGEVPNNPVCKAIQNHIAGGKMGNKLRTHFEEAPYGWSRDAIDGGLQALLTVGSLYAQDASGNRINPKELARRDIGKSSIRIESTIITTEQRLQIRVLFQKLGLSSKPNDEINTVPHLVQKLQDLARLAGGDAPKPALPDTFLLDDIRLAVGNEQLSIIYNKREELGENWSIWTATSSEISKRWESWLDLQEFIGYSLNIDTVEGIIQQADLVKSQRMLLIEPDLVLPLLRSLEDELRKLISQHHKDYETKYIELMKNLVSDSTWKLLSVAQQDEILDECNIEKLGSLSIGSRSKLLDHLKRVPIGGWTHRIDSLQARFNRARERAAKELEPETQTVSIPRRMVKTIEDIESWIAEVEKQLIKALSKGPIVIS